MVNPRAIMVAAACFTVCFGGCGGGAEEAKNTVTATSAAPPGDLEKIQEALVKAGIENPLTAVFDADDQTWSVVIAPDGTGPNGEPPPGRPIPERVLVGKSDFKVTRQGNPNERRDGPGLEGRE